MDGFLTGIRLPIQREERPNDVPSRFLHPVGCFVAMPDLVSKVELAERLESMELSDLLAFCCALGIEFAPHDLMGISRLIEIPGSAIGGC